jgi:hypothetical protein
VDLDGRLRRIVYDVVAERGAVPLVAELTSRLAAERPQTRADDVRGSLQRLAASRVFVLQPGSAEILMAPPFSAVPTPFLIESRRHRSFANCIWDSLGVSATLRDRVRVTTACGCCGESMLLDVSPDQPPCAEGVVHFAVPAASWWQDIVFT